MDIPSTIAPYGRLTHRDVLMHFVEAHNPQPRFLTPEQIEEWNEKGYILDVPLLSPSELAEAIAFFSQLEHDEALKFNTHARHPRGSKLVRHPRTLGYLQDLIGTDIVCFISEYLNKAPGASAGNHGHQDCVFNAMPVGSPIVWLALEDADETNGCMQFVPGSHRWGVLECDTGFALREVSPAWQWAPARVKAGYAVIMSDLLIHSSPANPSAMRYRPAFTATYASAKTPVLEQFNSEPVLCCGDTIHVSWKLQSRPG